MASSLPPTTPYFPEPSVATPYLVIINQPRQKVRYRYLSETRKEGHGYLRGVISRDPKSKTWITVQLVNWNGVCDVIVRCSLVTPEHTVHINLLRRKCNNNVTVQPYQDEKLKFTGNKWIAEFSYLSIVQQLLKKNDEEQKNTWKNFRDVVLLKFEAYTANGMCFTMPVYSQPVYNAKNPNDEALSILEVSKNEGLCTGGEKVLIFVKKINKKNVGIRFFETWGYPPHMFWTAEADFSPSDVHGGLGISFRTPPYHDLNIQTPVKVCFNLYYKNDESIVSEPKSFTYLPNNETRRHYGIPRNASEPMVQDQTANFTNYHQNVPHHHMTNRPNQHGNQSFFQPSSPFQTQQMQSPNAQMNPIQYPGFGEGQQLYAGNFNRIESTHFTNKSTSIIDDGRKCYYPPQAECPFPQQVMPLNIPSHSDILPEELLLTDDSNLSADEIGVLVTFSADQMGQMGSIGAGIDQMAGEWDEILDTIDGVESDAAETSPIQRKPRINPLRNQQNKIFAQDSNGENALHHAIWRNEIDFLRNFLAEAKVLSNDKTLKCINAANRIGWTPLHAAVLEKQTEVATLLLESGADPNLKDINGNTPTHVAAADSKLIDCLRVLIDKLENINVRNSRDLSPFHLAVSNKNTEGARLLMEKGADVTCIEKYGGNSALHTAVEKSAVDIVILLTKHTDKNDVNMKRADGKSVLDLAKECGSHRIRKILYNLGDSNIELSSDESEFTSDDESEDEFSDDSVEELSTAAADLKIEVSDKIEKKDDDKPK